LTVGMDSRLRASDTKKVGGPAGPANRTRKGSKACDTVNRLDKDVFDPA
jgi:hypothetical protein